MRIERRDIVTRREFGTLTPNRMFDRIDLSRSRGHLRDWLVGLYACGGYANLLYDGSYTIQCITPIGYRFRVDPLEAGYGDHWISCEGICLDFALDITTPPDLGLITDKEYQLRYGKFRMDYRRSLSL